MIFRYSSQKAALIDILILFFMISFSNHLSNTIFISSLYKMKTDSKMGLRNATNILNQLRRKYLKHEYQQTHPYQHNKTFIEEQSLELYQNQATNSNPRRSGYQKASNHEDPVEELSEIKQIEKDQPSFCDRLIVKQLEQTLKVYQQDLAVLTDNRNFLEEQIQFLADKIRKLKDLQHSNQIVTAQNEKSKLILNQLISQYHRSMHQLFKSKIAQQESFNALRNKVAKVIKETGQDYHYIGFVSYWNRHIEQCLTDRRAINYKIQHEQRLYKQKQIGKEGSSLKVQKVVVAGATKQKSSKLDDNYLAPDEPKPKKKLSEAEKANLLGDLKSFAKSFKLP